MMRAPSRKRRVFGVASMFLCRRYALILASPYGEEAGGGLLHILSRQQKVWLSNIATTASVGLFLYSSHYRKLT